MMEQDHGYDFKVSAFKHTIVIDVQCIDNIIIIFIFMNLWLPIGDDFILQMNFIFDFPFSFFHNRFD